jgi:hypothetical protein
MCVLSRPSDLGFHRGTFGLHYLRLSSLEFGENGQELVDAMDAHMPAENGRSLMLG